MNTTSLWVFGYGSLVWRPGFEYGDSMVGHINGFSRRFWQGNTTHRGIPGKPGRVATLLENQSAKTHGVAFQLLGEAALDYLQKRECTLGGYVTHMATFYPKDGTNGGNSFQVLLYTAMPSNDQWLGPAPLPDIAEQVISSSGATGHNVEYVLKLAQWFRDAVPDDKDEHLFTLEMIILQKIKEKKLCLNSMMSQKCYHEDPADTELNAEGRNKVEDLKENKDSDEADKKFEFPAKFKTPHLRCLNI